MFFMCLLLQTSLQLCRKDVVFEEFLSSIFPIYFFLNGNRSSWFAKEERDRELNSACKPVPESIDIRLWDISSLKNCQCSLVVTDLHKTCGRKYVRETMCVPAASCLAPQNTQKIALRSRIIQGKEQ